ncbi:MAG: hypothetical protein UV82_C0011G0023 [Candidatus Magasanikbacteria bacterium GW2011_GWD2_43_18]|uniref:Uncharacterized protein n=1 Tax=Candidatus Magasanikbacteria bacterium GW2011_GWE2_42_7 TaxID=1619052 RepID=A0A0G1BDX3_9BACT|nr:MAG: hypothetical protein UV18_C0007G0025 [Candidatus Magasanikbacteria bacterium GW2011_GWC2_42_27]KKS71389.1 MAG: hypothetical protein UV42_C0030G0007 [Candidatus Magasanikbacteria bacterium GW2011_GWE2_42_7]KKT04095.1 MAG: hypothetical protein UV82_C0011G0023 [Candidatus Magasanikbacteria bacterium GW2011_GWD2_43_18]HBB38543.1 hypothetical protein [Candidatus Magasanikbacteria bacterium]HCC13910.1 hypothetical protein [Candidatus Magasanikbacteria bacterium]
MDVTMFTNFSEAAAYVAVTLADTDRVWTSDEFCRIREALRVLVGVPMLQSTVTEAWVMWYTRVLQHYEEYLVRPTERHAEGWEYWHLGHWDGVHPSFPSGLLVSWSDINTYLHHRYLGDAVAEIYPKVIALVVRLVAATKVLGWRDWEARLGTLERTMLDGRFYR